MDIAVIGAGNVGLTLARAWRRAGLQVTVALRDPKAKRHEEVQAEFSVATIEDAVPQASATLLAVPGTALPELLSAGAAVLDGRLLLDATNAMGNSHLNQVTLLQQGVATSAGLPGLQHSWLGELRPPGLRPSRGQRWQPTCSSAVRMGSTCHRSTS
jgi:predicted dinucleotide-binding enzyme